MFIQVFKGHVAEPTEVRAAMEEWTHELAPGAAGWLGSTAGVTADGMFIGLARFATAAAAQRNSDRPEQQQWWMETSKRFAGEVTFHDCTQVVPFLRGGLDDAGFVQIIEGRTDDGARVGELMNQSAEPLRKLRPDLIGGIIAMHGDGGFTEAVYFTSEAAARAGERKEPTPQLRPILDEEMSLLRDLVYYDLTEPWLHSPG
jgi:hypothetical protein